VDRRRPRLRKQLPKSPKLPKLKIEHLFSIGAISVDQR